MGQRIASFLFKKNIPYVIVDENREVIARLRADEIPAVCGDSTDPSVLIQAHIARASMLVIAISDTFNIRPMIHCARKLNKNIEIVIRTHNKDEASLLKHEGPGKIFFAEEEIAKNMSLYVLDRFGKSI